MEVWPADKQKVGPAVCWQRLWIVDVKPNFKVEVIFKSTERTRDGGSGGLLVFRRLEVSGEGSGLELDQAGLTGADQGWRLLWSAGG